MLSFDEDKTLLSCYICKEGNFSTELDLIFHLKSYHNKSNIYGCDKCGLDFSSKERLNTHKNLYGNHNTESVIVCKYCGKSYSYKRSLKTHMKQNHEYIYYKLYPTIQKPRASYKCEYCSKSFSYYSSYEDHKRIHLNEPDNNNKEYENKCLTCGNSFRYVNNLLEHQKLWHSTFNYKCSFCKITSMDRDKMHNHEITHKEYYNKRECVYCGTQYHNKSELDDHLLTHRIPQYYRCCYCGIVFMDMFMLNDHLKLHVI